MTTMFALTLPIDLVKALKGLRLVASALTASLDIVVAPSVITSFSHIIIVIIIAIVSIECDYGAIVERCSHNATLYLGLIVGTSLQSRY